MDGIIPWNEWVEMIRPYYPKGKRGRPPLEIEKKLRMYFLQIWFSLSDEGTEEAMYDSYAFRKFSRIDFTGEQVPDATTLLKFRKLLVEKKLNEKLFKDVNERLEKAGLMVHGGKKRGRHYSRRPKIDKKQRGQVRRGDASDQERERMALRDEGPFRMRRADRLRAHDYGDGGERA